VLWVLRLLLAGPSTLQGFRAWVVEECPVAPGRKAAPDRPAQRVLEAGPAQVPCPPADQRRRLPDGQRTKRQRLLTLAAGRRDLASMPLGEVSRLATSLAEEIGYSAGTARRELIRHVRELQSGAAGNVLPGSGNGDDE